MTSYYIKRRGRVEYPIVNPPPHKKKRLKTNPPTYKAKALAKAKKVINCTVYSELTYAGVEPAIS